MDIIRPGKFSVILTQKRQVTSSVYLLTFTTSDNTVINYTSGQFATFIISPSIRRSYSFAGWSEDKTSFELLVDTHPGGPGSQYFLALQEGSSSDILAPLGKFGAIEGSTRPSVFIATGTGIAPFRSMLQKELTKTQNAQETGNKKQIQLFWGLRHEEDIYLQQELENFKFQISNFKFSIVLSQPKEDWVGERGHVTEHVLEFAKQNGSEYDWYLCGNNQMIKEVEAGLIALGIPAEQMKKDAYY